MVLYFWTKTHKFNTDFWVVVGYWSMMGLVLVVVRLDAPSLHFCPFLAFEQVFRMKSHKTAHKPQTGQTPLTNTRHCAFSSLSFTFVFSMGMSPHTILCASDQNHQFWFLWNNQESKWDNFTPSNRTEICKLEILGSIVSPCFTHKFIFTYLQS